jgi:thiol:disulfide interchange protein
MKKYFLHLPFLLSGLVLIIFAFMSCNTVKKSTHTEEQKTDSTTVKKQITNDLKKSDSSTSAVTATAINSITKSGLKITFSDSTGQAADTTPVTITKKADGTTIINPGGRNIKSIEQDDEKDTSASTQQSNQMQVNKSDSNVSKSKDSTHFTNNKKIGDSSKVTSVPLWKMLLGILTILAVFVGAVYLVFFCTVKISPIPPFVSIKRKTA